MRAALLAGWDLVVENRRSALFWQPPPGRSGAIGDFLESLWPWGPDALAPVLLAAWREALREAAERPEGGARLVLDGILRGLGGDHG
jgi:hypothetical protein